MLPKIARIALLFDFYGKLLTVKQQHLIDLYYNQDLSLGEISEECGVSRQAVYDILKRAVKSLENYEERLGLADTFRIQTEELYKLRRLLQDYTRHRDQAKLEEMDRRLAETLSKIER